MDIFTALHTRRSIRNYAEQPVTEQELRVLLDAAMIAPSAGNAQPWQFIIVDDPDILKNVPAINPYAAMAPKSPVSIVICGDLDAEKYKGYWVQDCSAAIQNMLLAATGLGALVRKSGHSQRPWRRHAVRTILQCRPGLPCRPRHRAGADLPDRAGTGERSAGARLEPRGEERQRLLSRPSLVEDGLPARHGLFELADRAGAGIQRFERGRSRLTLGRENDRRTFACQSHPMI